MNENTTYSNKDINQMTKLSNLCMTSYDNVIDHLPKDIMAIEINTRSRFEKIDTQFLSKKKTNDNQYVALLNYIPGNKLIKFLKTNIPRENIDEIIFEIGGDIIEKMNYGCRESILFIHDQCDLPNEITNFEIIPINLFLKYGLPISNIFFHEVKITIKTKNPVHDTPLICYYIYNQNGLEVEEKTTSITNKIWNCYNIPITLQQITLQQITSQIKRIYFHYPCEFIIVNSKNKLISDNLILQLSGSNFNAELILHPSKVIETSINFQYIYSLNPSINFSSVDTDVKWKFEEDFNNLIGFVAISKHVLRVMDGFAGIY